MTTALRNEAGNIQMQRRPAPYISPPSTPAPGLAQRWGLSSGKNVTQTEKDLKRLFAEETWNALHLQIIYYGREYCSGRGCDGTVCEICTTCYPDRKNPKKTKKA